MQAQHQGRLETSATAGMIAVPLCNRQVLTARTGTSNDGKRRSSQICRNVMFSGFDVLKLQVLLVSF
jgi:hypothetical protein